MDSELLLVLFSVIMANSAIMAQEEDDALLECVMRLRVLNWPISDH